jgi:hypothetical protein
MLVRNTPVAIDVAQSNRQPEQEPAFGCDRQEFRLNQSEVVHMFFLDVAPRK